MFRPNEWKETPSKGNGFYPLRAAGTYIEEDGHDEFDDNNNDDDESQSVDKMSLSTNSEDVIESVSSHARDEV